MDNPTLDCQDCGKILRALTPAEAQAVAANPYNYIVYCDLCKNRECDSTLCKKLGYHPAHDEDFR